MKDVNNYRFEIITKLTYDVKNKKIDEYAKTILNDPIFEYDVYLEKKLNDKFVVIQKDKSKWNEKYFLDHLSLLRNNFSKERLEHVLELREYLYRKSNILTNRVVWIGAGILLITLPFFLKTNTNMQDDKKTSSQPNTSFEPLPSDKNFTKNISEINISDLHLKDANNSKKPIKVNIKENNISTTKNVDTNSKRDDNTLSIVLSDRNDTNESSKTITTDHKDANESA